MLWILNEAKASGGATKGERRIVEAVPTASTFRSDAVPRGTPL
ncbi:hypothetical protein RAS2_18420 [Phycisphaerae bacterium RAS2]|nr:hypothetical protein RAS2_18420 [Phycisphaerae bacterium RAS2]